eukprot:COSAG04_NODE_7_length_45988_cov_220.188869_9_plen_144_part_00
MSLCVRRQRLGTRGRAPAAEGWVRPDSRLQPRDSGGKHLDLMQYLERLPARGARERVQPVVVAEPAAAAAPAVPVAVPKWVPGSSFPQVRATGRRTFIGRSVSLYLPGLCLSASLLLFPCEWFLLRRTAFPFRRAPAAYSPAA